jgi:hypothetical protein
MKIGSEDSKAYFRIKPPFPAFRGVALPNKKIGLGDPESYFRTKTKKTLEGLPSRAVKKERV